MGTVRKWLGDFGGVAAVLSEMDRVFQNASRNQNWMLEGMVREEMEVRDEVSF